MVELWIIFLAGERESVSLHLDKTEQTVNRSEPGRADAQRRQDSPSLGLGKALTARLLGGDFISNQATARSGLLMPPVEREEMGFLFARALRAVHLGSQYRG